MQQRRRLKSDEYNNDRLEDAVTSITSILSEKRYFDPPYAYRQKSAESHSYPLHAVVPGLTRNPALTNNGVLRTPPDSGFRRNDGGTATQHGVKRFLAYNSFSHSWSSLSNRRLVSDGPQVPAG
jgi:hypothetical protein